MFNDNVSLMDLNGRTFTPVKREMESLRTEGISERMTGDGERRQKRVRAWELQTTSSPVETV